MANTYLILNDKGENIGKIQQKLSTGAKVLRLFLDMFLDNAMLPFMLEIQNNNDGVEAVISRGFTFFMSKIIISDGSGNKLGSVQQKFKLFKPNFKIYDSNEVQIAEITGDWKALNFTITDAAGTQIGTIADKYNVSIDPTYANKENKIAILASAITIDMVTTV
ncbi:MAG: scramblase [Cyanobacteria bacterium LVE1205-1]